MENVIDVNVANEAAVEKQEFARVLKLKEVVLYGMAYLAPGTIFGTYGLVTTLTHGMTSLSYLVATIAMLFTALSYKKMVSAFPVAGSVYAYAQKSINPYVGFLSGWSILLDYMLIPMINFLIASIFLKPIFPNVPAWVWIISMTVITFFANYRGISFAAKVDNFLVIIQFLFLGVFLLFAIKYILGGGGTGCLYDWSAFVNTSELHSSGGGFGMILAGASILALSFLGFDAVTTLAEETVNPEKTIGKAILIICLGMGVVFIITSFIMQSVWPNGWKEFASPDSGSYELIVKVGGSVLGYIFTVVTVFGTLASAIASQASASRILYGMGRDGILPTKFFGYLHPKYKTPTFNIILISVVALAGLFLSLSIATSLVNFGALIGFIVVNISVIGHFLVKNKARKASDYVTCLVLPICGAIVCFFIWISLDIHSKILGFSWLLFGFVYMGITTKWFKELPKDMQL